MNSDADQVLEDPWCSDALLAWPSAQEWEQPAFLQVASQGDSSQQGPAVHDRAQVREVDLPCVTAPHTTKDNSNLAIQSTSALQRASHTHS